MAAGAATLSVLGEPGTYERLEALADRVAASLRDAATKGERPVTLNQVGAMMTLFFCDGPVESFADAKRADTGVYATYYRHMLERGVYLAPSQFESAMISLALTEDDLGRAAEAAAAYFAG